MFMNKCYSYSNSNQNNMLKNKNKVLQRVTDT